MTQQSVAKGMVLVGGVITLVVIPVVVIGVTLIGVAFAIGFAQDTAEVANEGGQLLLMILGCVLVAMVGLIVAWIRALRGKRISLGILIGVGALVGWTMSRMFLDWLSGDNGVGLMALLATAALGPLGMAVGALVLLVFPAPHRGPGAASGSAPTSRG